MLRIVILLLALTVTGLAQLDKLRAEIRAVYTPVDLKNDSDLGRAAIFLGGLKKRPDVAQWMEALRAELDDSRSGSRMRTHGTATLLFLSESPENLAFAARMLPRIDFREVRIFGFWTLASRLAQQNVDISLAVFRLLERPDVRLQFDLPGLNDFSFNQAELVTDLLLPTSEKYWADQAIERLSSEKDPTAQQTLLRLVWYAQSDFGDAELERFANDSKRPVSSRTLARELMARDPSLSAEERNEVFLSTEDELRARRQSRTKTYVKNVIPIIERDTLKILLKRLTAYARK
jgi:hypothetical protein